MNNQQVFVIDGQRWEDVPSLSAFYSSAAFEDKYTYDGMDLGASVKEGKTEFRLWSPMADKAVVRLYATGSDMEEGAKVIDDIPMEKDEKHPGVYFAAVDQDLSRTYYAYVLTIGERESETGDPYASAAGINGLRSMVVDLDIEKPEGWDEDDYCFAGAATEAVVWEVHVKDFSGSPDSGMKNKGKYLAFTERGTKVEGSESAPTGTDYLVKQGITHIHLLPISSNGSVNEMVDDPGYNWGYDPINYNVPEGSFSTDPWHGETAVLEFREAVLALHKAGIGVVLDVVYNHTFLNEASWFEQTMPYYYHRTDEKGKFANASCCNNETASERSMMRNYMLQSIRYLAETYHVDGFRFDLMGIHDVDTMNAIRRMLDEMGKKNGKRYLMYGEPWAAGVPSMTKGAVPADMTHKDLLLPGIAVFNDRTRDVLKGSAFEKDGRGFISGKEGMEEAASKAICAYCLEANEERPDRTVTYVSSHDNYTLWDKLTFTLPTDGSGFDEPEMRRVAVNKLAAAMVLTSQGMPFFQGGEEMGRSKRGEGNSYRSDVRINNIAWERTLKFEELVSYYRELIKIRASFSPFTEETGRGARSIRFFQKSDKKIGYVIPGMKTGEPKWMAIMFNASDEVSEMEIDGIPEEECRWRVLADERAADLRSLGNLEGRRVRVFMRSALILASETRIR